jgi:capsular exopolysaccharide synthesis family protein
MIAGLVGGIFLVFGKEYFQSRVHTADDVRKIAGTCSIAMIPEFASDGNTKSKLLAGLRPGPRSLMGPADKFLLSRPNSPEAEAMRSLYTSVMLTRPDNPPKALLIASPFQGEGKTTVAINLAIALSQRSRTVLIDADLRRPGVALAFGLTERKGLSEVLDRSAQLNEVLVSSATTPNLFILPAGCAPTSASRLACSRAVRRLLDLLREQFEHIVIDSPPILAFSDARALSPLVDGVILVGRSGSTTRQALNRSMELLTEVHSAPVLDVVLNAAAHLNFPAYGYSAYAVS